MVLLLRSGAHESRSRVTRTGLSRQKISTIRSANVADKSNGHAVREKQTPHRAHTSHATQRKQLYTCLKLAATAANLGEMLAAVHAARVFVATQRIARAQSKKPSVAPMPTAAA